VRFSPALYNWFQNRRIYKLYSELMELEDQMASSPSGRMHDFVERLDRLEQHASRLSLPLSYQPLVYQLRSHIGVVRQKIEKQPAQEMPAPH
jgi:hypothetical protein